MKIHEYQAKGILKANGITIPDGNVVDNIDDGLSSAEKIGFPLVIKAQVHVGGRGKAGAIRIVSNMDEFKKEFPSILGMEVKGLKVEKVLLERAMNIDKQFYLGIIVDRSNRVNSIMASAEGGVEIEEVAKSSPDKIVSLPLDRATNINEEAFNRLASSLNLSEPVIKPFMDIVKALVAAYANTDAQLVEINPLVLTKEGELIACDAKMIIDDNALFRHEDLKDLKEAAEDNELEKEAHNRGIAYVKLPGNVGIIGNGAGLVMATMDEVKRAGGAPANFLDIGGGAKKEGMQNSLEIIYMDKDVDGIFINVFGGITRCDEVAEGIIEVIKDVPRDIPIVLRLAGTKSEEGKQILKGSDLISADSMEEGAKKIVALIKDKAEK